MEIGERVARLETEMTAALAGVANFKSFQAEARDFFLRPRRPPFPPTPNQCSAPPCGASDTGGDADAWWQTTRQP